MEHQMNYKTGTVGEFMAWTKRMLANFSATEETPKQWFDNDATAARALNQTTKSLERARRLATPKKPAS